MLGVNISAIGRKMFIPALAIGSFIAVGYVSYLSGLDKVIKAGLGAGLMVFGATLFKGTIRTVVFILGVALVLTGVLEFAGIVQPTGSLHIGNQKGVPSGM